MSAPPVTPPPLSDEEKKLAADFDPHRFHALLIGIDKYAQRPLQGCVNDIDAVQDLLTQRLRISAQRLRKLVAPHDDAQRIATPGEALPTYAAIVAALKDLAGPSVQPGDRVMQDYRHVLFATDLSPRAARVGARAQDLAVRYGARLSFVHVIEEVNVSAGYELMPLLPELPDETLTRESVGTQPAMRRFLVDRLGGMVVVLSLVAVLVLVEPLFGWAARTGR